VAVTWALTAAFAVVAVAAVLATDALGPVLVVVSLAAFALGLVAFAVALVTAAARSRREELSVAGLFFLSGSAPAGVRRHLLGALATQTVVALAAAGLRPFTALAFGILVPTSGLGACGLWAARHGTFPSRSGAGAAIRGAATPRPRHGP
jgi:hypothetical protein